MKYSNEPFSTVEAWSDLWQA